MAAICTVKAKKAAGPDCWKSTAPCARIELEFFPRPQDPVDETKEMEAAPGIKPGDHGFAGRCLITWLCRLERKDVDRACPRIAKEEEVQSPIRI